MPVSRGSERILVVENNPDIRDLVARQALTTSGYQVKTATTASTAIQLAMTFSPDLIITNLHLPDLSGKDLLVALSSQGTDLPVILIAEHGMEADVIQAFRLGASDYLNWPAREAEVLAAVERALKNVRFRREREELEKQIKQTNFELQRRVRELTTIFSLGKAVTSVMDQHQLLNKILDGAVFVSEADRGWLLLRDERSRIFLLRAYKNMPKNMQSQLNQPFDDGVSSLVALSGEVLSMHGSSVGRFKISQWGQSVMVLPIKAKKEVVGLMTVVRNAPKPFDRSAQSLLEAVADYASISLVNAKLFEALEDRASRLERAIQGLRKSEEARSDMVEQLRRAMSTPLVQAVELADQMTTLQNGKLSREYQELLVSLHDKLVRVQDIATSITALHDAAGPNQSTIVDIRELARQAIANQRTIAEKKTITISSEFPDEPTPLNVDPKQMLQVFEHLLENAIKFSQPDGKVSLRIAVPTTEVLISVEDHGSGINTKDLPYIFDRFYQANDVNIQKMGGLGIGLTIVREVVTAHGGWVTAESRPGRGTLILVTLPKNIS